MIEDLKYRNDYVVYFHRNRHNGDIFYVGIGQMRRAYCFTEGSRNFLWNRYVKKHGKPIVDIYKTNLRLYEANHLEQFFIRKIGRLKHREGTLVNLTIGGEGGTVFKITEDKLCRLKEQLKNRKIPKGVNHWAYGIKLPKNHNFLNFAKGSTQSKEHVEKRVAPTAAALGIKKGYFAGMMCGSWKNKTNCDYLEIREPKTKYRCQL